MTQREILGKNIRDRRQELGLTQVQLALACGMKDRKNIIRYESGAFAPTADVLVDIAMVLQTTPNDLLDFMAVAGN